MILTNQPKIRVAIVGIAFGTIAIGVWHSVQLIVTPGVERSKFTTARVTIANSRKSDGDTVQQMFTAPDSHREIVLPTHTENVLRFDGRVKLTARDSNGETVADVQVKTVGDQANNTSVTDSAGEVEIAIPDNVHSLLCEGFGYVPALVELLPGKTAYVAILRRPESIEGSLTFHKPQVLVDATRVYAFRSEIPVSSVHQILAADSPEIQQARGVFEVGVSPDGAFLLSGVEADTEYVIAVAGGGVVCTTRHLLARAGNRAVRVPCAYAYGIAVTFVDQFGKQVNPFSSRVYGSAATSMQLEGSGNFVKFITSSLVLSNVPENGLSREVQPRNLIVTHDERVPLVGPLSIEFAIENIVQRKAQVFLRSIEYPLELGSIALDRISTDVGECELQLIGVEPDNFPASKLLFHCQASDKWVAIDVGSEMFDEHNKCLLENIPCADYQVQLVGKNSDEKWPRDDSTWSVRIESSRCAPLPIEIDSRASIDIRFVGPDSARLISEGGVMLSIGLQSRNEDFESKRRLRTSHTRTVSSASHVVRGLGPGGYIVAVIGPKSPLVSKRVTINDGENAGVEIELREEKK